MKTILINRYTSTRNGTQSHVSVVGHEQTWHGLERPWLDNLPFESCIPTGIYGLLPHTSPMYGECRVFIGGSVAINPDHVGEGSAERFLCLVHSANYTRQLQGCLALGTGKSDYHEAEDSYAVWNSRIALKQFQDVLGYRSAECVISWNYQ